MYDHFGACGVDPRNLAQRIMEVRASLLLLQGLGLIAQPALHTTSSSCHLNMRHIQHIFAEQPDCSG